MQEKIQNRTNAGKNTKSPKAGKKFLLWDLD
jgi:hypothetical protein